MPKKSRAAVARERELLLEMIKVSPAGFKQLDLRRVYESRAGKPISYTTLRRRLEELESGGLIARSRRGNNPTYRATEEPDAEPAITPDQRRQNVPPKEPEGLWRPSRDSGAEETAVIPLSREAAALLDLVRRPRAQRTPVTYEPRFLDEYEPGRSWYLPPALREHLRAIGTTAYADQPAGTYARDIMQRLIIDLSWGSSKLEGNKYSRIDTEELIRAGHEAQGASATDRQMILNHKAAIEFLVENAQDIDFNRYTVLGLHTLLAENLMENRDDEGRLRTRPITIGTSVYVPTAIPQVIEERFDTILTKARAIPDSLEQSFFVMIHIPYLQPFLDVNKRTSRLAANISLIKANLCPLSFVDVPEEAYTEGTLAIYEQSDVALLRDVFAWAYERSCSQFTVLRQAMGAPDPIRLNYRLQLRGLVEEVVAGGTWPSDADLLARAEAYGVADRDRAAFVTSARRDLRGLRAEHLSRYRLRHSQFLAWLDAIADARERPVAAEYDDR